MIKTMVAMVAAVLTCGACSSAPPSTHDELVAKGCFQQDFEPGSDTACNPGWSCQDDDARDGGAPLAGCRSAGGAAPGYWCCPE